MSQSSSRRSRKAASLTQSAVARLTNSHRSASTVSSRRGKSVVSFAIKPKTRTPKNQITSRQSFRTVSAPATSSRIVRRSRTNATHVERFSDFFASVTVTTATVSGEILVNKVQNLANLGQRISAMGGLYARWKVRRLRFRYVTASSTTQSGTLTMAHFADANYSISAALGSSTTPSASAISSAMNEAEDSVSFPAWEPDVELPVRAKGDKLYTTVSQSTGVQVNMIANGVLLVAQGASPTYDSARTLGSVYVDGEVEFSDPIYSPGTLISSLPQGYTAHWAATTASAQLAATFSSTSGSVGDIQAPFIVCIPSKTFAWGGLTFLAGIPIFFAADGAGSTVTYGAFASPEAYGLGSQFLALSSAGAPSADTNATLFFPASF